MKNDLERRIRTVFYENTHDNSYEACINFENINSLIEKLLFLHTHTPGRYFQNILWRIKTDKEVKPNNIIELKFKRMICIGKDEYKLITNDGLDGVAWEDLDKEWKVVGEEVDNILSNYNKSELK